MEAKINIETEKVKIEDLLVKLTGAAILMDKTHVSKNELENIIKTLNGIFEAVVNGGYANPPELLELINSLTKKLDYVRWNRN